LIAVDTTGPWREQGHQGMPLADGAGDDELFVCHGSSGALAANFCPHHGLACPIIQDPEDFTMLNASTVDKKTVTPFSFDKSKHPDEPKQTMLVQPSITNTMAKLSDLPVELVNQLMAWMMVDELSERSTRSLGCVSKQFHAALHEFIQGDWYAKFSSNQKMQQAATNWIRSFLNQLNSRPYTSRVQSSEELIADIQTLSFVPSKPIQARQNYYFGLDEQSSVAFDEHSLKALRAYGAQAIHIVLNDSSADSLLLIDSVLPPRVLLHVNFSGYHVTDTSLAKIIKQLANSNRQLSLAFNVLCDLSKMPDSRKALFETLCNTSNVIHVSMSCIDKPDAMFTEFVDYCDAISGVQLFSIETQNCIDLEVLQNIIAALEKRVEQGKSPMVFALGLPWVSKDNPIHYLTGKNIEFDYAQIGLFCRGVSEPYDQEFLDSLSKALNNRSFGTDVKDEARVNTDSDVESDSFIDSSDEEVAPNVLHDEEKPAKPNARAKNQEDQTRQSADVVFSQPRVKNRKRDKCVVS
jgi:hypothetical protein